MTWIRTIPPDQADDELRRCYEAGFAAHMTKPIGIDDLLAKIRELGAVPAAEPASAPAPA